MALSSSHTHFCGPAFLTISTYAKSSPTASAHRATPASVSVIPTPKSHAAELRSWPPSEIPAQTPEARPFALSAERSDPLLSWPMRWETYSSGFVSYVSCHQPIIRHSGHRRCRVSVRAGVESVGACLGELMAGTWPEAKKGLHRCTWPHRGARLRRREGERDRDLVDVLHGRDAAQQRRPAGGEGEPRAADGRPGPAVARDRAEELPRPLLQDVEGLGAQEDEGHAVGAVVLLVVLLGRRVSNRGKSEISTSCRQVNKREWARPHTAEGYERIYPSIRALSSNARRLCPAVSTSSTRDFLLPHENFRYGWPSTAVAHCTCSRRTWSD